jgi:hypothetical protein
LNMNFSQSSRQTKPRNQVATASKRFSAAKNQFQNLTRRRLVMVFVLLHLVAISLFSLPVEAFPFTALRGLLAPYMRCVGLNEMWNTFAPNPKSAEQYLKAVVVTLNGDIEVYSFPRMEELSFYERYRKERYRKFAESALCNDCSGLWPDIEKEVARRAMNPLDPPDRVILLKFESPIDPKTGAVGDEAHAKPTVFAEKSIESVDLQ